jgi:hypothetical protein
MNCLSLSKTGDDAAGGLIQELDYRGKTKATSENELMST